MKAFFMQELLTNLWKSEYGNSHLGWLICKRDMLKSCFDVIYDFVCLLDHVCRRNSQYHAFITKASHTDGQTDPSSYRDAKTHLKIMGPVKGP